MDQSGKKDGSSGPTAGGNAHGLPPKPPKPANANSNTGRTIINATGPGSPFQPESYDGWVPHHLRNLPSEEGKTTERMAPDELEVKRLQEEKKEEKR